MDKMRILLIEPLKKPEVREIGHSVDEMQRIVGGTFGCTYPWDDLVGLLYADDGIALGYPPNRAIRNEDGLVTNIIMGTFFIAGLTSDSFCSLTDDQIAKFSALFEAPEMYSRTPEGGILCIRPMNGFLTVEAVRFAR